jgi:hypothetical protein
MVLSATVPLDRRRTLFLMKLNPMQKASSIPALAEPWFLTFNAGVEFHVVMGQQELQDAGLDKLGKKWA